MLGATLHSAAAMGPTLNDPDGDKVTCAQFSIITSMGNW